MTFSFQPSHRTHELCAKEAIRLLDLLLSHCATWHPYQTWSSYGTLCIFDLLNNALLVPLVRSRKLFRAASWYTFPFRTAFLWNARMKPWQSNWKMVWSPQPQPAQLLLYLIGAQYSSPIYPLQFALYSYNVTTTLYTYLFCSGFLLTVCCGIY